MERGQNKKVPPIRRA